MYRKKRQSSDELLNRSRSRLSQHATGVRAHTHRTHTTRTALTLALHLAHRHENSVAWPALTLSCQGRKPRRGKVGCHTAMRTTATFRPVSRRAQTDCCVTLRLQYSRIGRKTRCDYLSRELMQRPDVSLKEARAVAASVYRSSPTQAQERIAATTLLLALIGREDTLKTLDGDDEVYDVARAMVPHFHELAKSAERSIPSTQ